MTITSASGPLPASPCVADSHAAVSACLRPVHPCCSRLVPALPSLSSVCCSVGHLSGGPAARHWSDRSSDSLIGDSGWVWILTPGLCLLSQTLICHPHAEPSCHPQKPIRLPPHNTEWISEKEAETEGNSSPGSPLGPGCLLCPGGTVPCLLHLVSRWEASEDCAQVTIGDTEAKKVHAVRPGRIEAGVSCSAQLRGPAAGVWLR